MGDAAGPSCSTKRRSAGCRKSCPGPTTAGRSSRLPQVYTEDADRPGLASFQPGHVSRAACRQRYQPDRQAGLHYQIHRGIGVHHAAALRKGVPFRVNVFVGGPPAMTLAAVMPLPEGLPELAFAGALGGRRVRLDRYAGRRSTQRCRSPPRPISASAASSTPTCNCPKARSAITWAITAWASISRC